MREVTDSRVFVSFSFLHLVSKKARIGSCSYICVVLKFLKKAVIGVFTLNIKSKISEPWPQKTQAFCIQGSNTSDRVHRHEEGLLSPPEQGEHSS